MFDFMQWMASLISSGIVGITGGNTLIMFLLLLFGMAYILSTAGISMPFSAVISFFVIGTLATLIDNPLDPIVGTGAFGFGKMTFLILLAVSGLLIWHLFFKKSQAGS